MKLKKKFWRSSSKGGDRESGSKSDGDIEEGFGSGGREELVSSNGQEGSGKVRRLRVSPSAQKKPPKPGVYQVMVHIIEGRELRGRDAGGTSDPVCIVDCFGERESTEVVKKRSTVFWDKVFFFTKEVSSDELDATKINISVFDSNPLKRNVLIGSFDVDAVMVQEKKGHEMYRQWIALSDTTDKNEGIQGYIRATIRVLGPDDEPVAHEEDEETEEGAPSDIQVLLPPSVRQVGGEVILRIFKAEELPKLNARIVSSKDIDPYVRATFAGVSLSTDVKGDTSPEWNAEMRLPVIEPTLTDKIMIRVFDEEKLSSDKVVGTATLSYSDLWSEDEESAAAITDEPFWINLYGSQHTQSGKIADAMNSGSREGCAYRGRVLIQTHKRRQEDAKATVKLLKEVPHEPETIKCILRLDIYELTELPINGKVHLEFALGQYLVQTGELKTTDGRALLYLSMDDVFVNLNAEMGSVPDLFVYLVYKGKRVAYLRFGAETLFGWQEPKWLGWTRDPIYDVISASDFPGLILLSAQLGEKDEMQDEGRTMLVLPQLVTYRLQIRLYQARRLPSADTDGELDPYVVIRCGGQQAISSSKKKSLAPVWMEEMEMLVDLPESKSLSPSINVVLYDQDLITSDDLVGRFAVDIGDIERDFRPVPRWRKLQHVSPDLHNDGKSEILIEFALREAHEPRAGEGKKWRPLYKQCTMEISTIGLRDLAAAMLVPVNEASVEYSIDGVGGADGDIRFSTQSSCRPSSRDPNILESETISLSLPVLETFAPSLKITVYDHHKFLKRKLASTLIPVSRFVPWYSEAKKRRARTRLQNAKHFIVSSKMKRSAEPEPQQEDENEDEESGDENTPLLFASKQLKDAFHEGVDQAKKMKVDYEKSAEKRGYLRACTNCCRDQIIPIPGWGIEDTDSDEADDRDDDDDEEEDLDELLDLSPPYLKDRQMFKTELENKRNLKPFLEEPLYKATFSLDMSRVVVGKWKGFIRVWENSKPKPERPFDLTKVLAPKPYIIRAYMLHATELTPQDFNGSVDPYLVVKLGKAKVDTEKEKFQNDLAPKFHKAFELQTTLPGPSTLDVSVMDYDFIGRNDLVGSTTIDLENRVFSEDWKSFYLKPVEARSLHTPTAGGPQGSLRMWIDIMSPAEAKKEPMVDISLPPPQQWELRVVIWRAKGMTCKDTVTNQNDLFITGNLEGQGRQETDIHWRAKKGKGSFNWRMVFPVELPTKQPYFTLQAWDQDIVLANDVIGETTLKLDRLFKKCMLTNLQQRKKARWIPLTHPEKEGPQGYVKVEFEVLPIERARGRPAAKGRSAPNQYPVLPPPTRVKFSILRPIDMMKELLGPELCYKFQGVCYLLCCIIVWPVLAFTLMQIKMFYHITFP